MKRFLAVLFIALTTQAFSQSYFHKGTQIKLGVRGDRAAVILKSNSLSSVSKESLVRRFTDSNMDVEESVENVFIIQAKDGSSISGLKGQIESASAGSDLVKFVTDVYYGESQKVSQIPTDEFVVRLRGLEDTSKLRIFNIENNVKILGNVSDEKGFLLKSGDDVRLNALELSSIYYSSGIFEFAEPNFVYPQGCLLNYNPNDQFYSKQWALNNTGQLVATGGSQAGDIANVNAFAGADIDADKAWDIVQGSQNVKIGIFDTGIDSTHPEFNQTSRILRGYDAIYNKYGVPKDSGNFGGHGTCVSGLTSALANNLIGVAGVASGCRFMSFRIFNLTGASTSVGIGRAFDTARVTGVDVLVNSWNGFTPSSVVTDAITNAAIYGRGGLGCLIFFAAGNDGKGEVWYPSYLPEVVSVGASTNYDQKKAPGTGNQFVWGSNYGENEHGDIDVVAPTICYTTDIQGFFGYVSAASPAGDYYATFSGTSCATPIAAGSAALIISLNNSLSRTSALEYLYRGCDKIENTDYPVAKPYGRWSYYMGYGRVNAYHSVQLSRGVDVTPPTISHKNIESHSSTFPTHITAYIADQDGSAVPDSGAFSPKLFYRTNKLRAGWSGFDSVNASISDQGEFTFILPAYGHETEVQYYIRAYDGSGNGAYFPKGAPNNFWLCYFAIGSFVEHRQTIGGFQCQDGGRFTLSPAVTFGDFTVTQASAELYVTIGRVSDLIIQLYTPGTDANRNRKCLFASNGGTGSDIKGAWASDSGSILWLNSVPPYSDGSFKADYFLSGVNGMSALGDWRILSYDQLINFSATFDSVIISLNGLSGIPSPCAVLISPADSVINFGKVELADSISRSITIRNEGNSELEISSVNFSGLQASKFSVADSLPVSVMPGDSCVINVDLKVTLPGGDNDMSRNNDSILSAVMEVATNDPSKPVFTFALITENEIRDVSILDLRLLIQGFYDSNTDSLTGDTIKVVLRNHLPPFDPVDSATAFVQANGLGRFVFFNAQDSIQYLLQIIHRNSIETWSNDSGLMFSSRISTFDFTADSTLAYGNNLVRVDSKPPAFAIYSGDVDVDGFIDGTDIQFIYNDAIQLATGYLVTDLNGDEIVDGTDALIADNNAFLFISKIVR